MKKIDERQLVERMHRAYKQRLMEVLGETEVRDSHDNVVIKPGLKVRHKASQFEYTVDSVEGDPETGKLTITMLSPETPRFDPPHGEEFIGEQTPLIGTEPAQLLADEPAPRGEVGPDSVPEEDVVFVVDEKEFEKDYEVK